MSEGFFIRVPPCIHLGSHGRHRTERRISDVQSEIVTRCLEHRQCALEELSQPLRRPLWFEVVVEPPLQNAAAELADVIANGSCSLGKRVGTLKRFASRARPEQREAKVVLQADVDLVRGNKPGGAPEQIRGGNVVGPRQGALAGGGQPAPRRRG
jgi:hypothetical protein